MPDNGQKPLGSIAKTGLNLLRKFSRAMTAANSTSSSSVKCRLRRLKNLYVIRFFVYVIHSANSQHKRPRNENKSFLLQLPSTASTLSAADPFCIALDALMSIQKGQPLILAVLTQTR